MKYPLIANAFPAFPLAEIPQFPVEGMMMDCSYQHDECPSFCLEDKPNIQLWINRERPEDRAGGVDAPRFNVAYTSEREDESIYIYTGDDLEAAMAAVMKLDELTEQHGDLDSDRVKVLFGVAG